MSDLRSIIERELVIGDTFKTPLLRLLDDMAVFPPGWSWECGGDPEGRVEVWIMNEKRAIVMAERGQLAHVIRHMAVSIFQLAMLHESQAVKDRGAKKEEQA